MKKLLALCAAAAVLALVTGCPPTSTTPTGTKPTTPTPTKPTAPTAPTTPTAEGSISLAAGLKAEVEAGKDAKVMVKITRKDYKGPVDVTFEAPADSKVTADKVTIAADKDDAEATIKADKEAKKGDVKVSVTAKPADAKVKEAKGEIAVTVK